MMHCFLLKPRVVWRAEVDAMYATPYPLTGVNYANLTLGNAAAVKAGMTVRFGNSSGMDDLGRQRIAQPVNIGSPTTGNINMGLTPQGTHDGEADLYDGASIEILDDYRVWAKLPSIRVSFTTIELKDGWAGSIGNVENPPPVANGGPGFAATIDPTTHVITHRFNGAQSFQFDPSISDFVSGISIYQWDIVDGTLTAGTLTSAGITATFPAGFRWVRLTVTSGVSSGSKTHTHNIPVFARDPAADVCFPFQITSHRMAPRGQEISVKVLADVPRSDYPDGTLVMIWEDEPVSAGSDGSHMIFTGWHQSDANSVQTQATGTLRDSILNCVDVNGRLQTLPGLSQVVNAGETAIVWQYTRYPTLLYYLWYLLHWHSTALEVADLIIPQAILQNFRFWVLTSDENTLYQQVADMAAIATPDHYLTCNRLGQMLLVVDPMLLALTDRDLVSTSISIAGDDCLSQSFSDERPPKVSQLTTWALISSSSDATAIKCVAPGPGSARGQGATVLQTSKRYADSQYTLNQTEGMRYAKLNPRHPPLNFTINYRLVRQLDPALMAWVEYFPYDTPRLFEPTIVAASQRGLVQEINISYDYSDTGQSATASISWQEETYGPPALTVDLPLDSPPPTFF